MIWLRVASQVAVNHTEIAYHDGHEWARGCLALRPPSYCARCVVMAGKRCGRRVVMFSSDTQRSPGVW